jgi:hypothetical protein
MGIFFGIEFLLTWLSIEKVVGFLTALVGGRG